MSASWPGSMRGPRVKTPILLLLLLLLSALTGTVLCQDDLDLTDLDAGTEGVEPGVEHDDTQTSASSAAPDATSTTTLIPTDEGGSVENPVESEHGSGHGSSRTLYPEVPDGPESTGDPIFVDPTSVPENEGMSPIIVLIPVVLVVVIIGMIVCGIFINRKWNNKARIQELGNEDPYLDESSTEKVPMPMFEEDVPSVLELEMEELDQWMKKDGETADDSKPV